MKKYKGVIMSIFENTKKPTGLGGKLMVTSMNLGHSSLSNWGLSHIQLNKNMTCLDVGCGGGANIKQLLKKCSQVYGLDYSKVSVEKSKSVNKKAITEKRCEILQGDVQNLPFQENTFDLVTAFETIYFWPDLHTAFLQIYKVLKEEGTFLICNEYKEQNEKNVKWTNIIEGMRIYSSSQLSTILKSAGFTNIEINEKKDWLCIIAKK